MGALKSAVGRKITGADLQALQAVMTALRKSQGESFDDLVAAEIPLAVLIAKRHNAGDLQRAARDWDTSLEAVTETLNKRRTAFTRFLCEALETRVDDVPARYLVAYSVLPGIRQRRVVNRDVEDRDIWQSIWRILQVPDGPGSFDLALVARCHSCIMDQMSWRLHFENSDTKKIVS